MMLGDPRTDNSYVAMALDALSSATTSAAAGARFTATQAVSVDAWIRFNGLPANTVAIGQTGVFSFGSQGPAVYFQFGALPAILSDLTLAQLQDDTWHYICMTFDGSMVRLYIDGQFNTGQSCMGSVTSNSNPVTIGQGVQGLVRRVRIYNTALNAATVLSNMYGAPLGGSLVADFDFSVNPPVDRGPSAYPIALQNTAGMLKVSPAVSMGTTGFVRPMGDKGINPGGAQVDPYTVQGWVYASNANNAVQALFVNSDLMLDTGMALYLAYDNTVSAFRLVSQRGSNGGSGQLLTSAGKIPVGVWTNVATTFDGTILSLYINGVLDSSKACPPIPLYSPVSDLLIGAAIQNGVPTGTMTLQGYIREIDVWAVALDAAAIAANMTTPPDVATVGLSAAYVFTNSPARNQTNGHPIGLAEGAVLSGQLGAAPLTGHGAAALDDAPPPEMGLPAAQMEKLRSELDFAAVAKANSARFDAAMAADLAAFSKAEDQALIKEAWLDARRKLAEDPTALPFLTTRHKIDGEHLIVVHRPQGSYVAYRADAAAVDDCTLWKINLVFILIAGALDAFTGVGARLGDKAIQYIGTILANPRIAAVLANGQGMSASAVFLFLSLMYTNGFLRPLILMIIDVGFWTLIRVVANMILIACGVGSARVIASLVATAVTFGVAYAAKPSACTPLPTVVLDNLSFDYDPTGVAVDGLTLRKNYADNVRVPEWVKGMTVAADSPCAYAITAIAGKTPTIKATFTISATTSQTVNIRATTTGILGSIDPITVDFSRATSIPVTLNLSHQTLAAGGVQRQDMTWTWQYQIAGGPWTTITTSSHRVYVLLSPPTPPWKQTANRYDTQLPWTDVLDYACAWAAGATTSDAAINMITTKVNSNIGLVYDTALGASVYTDKGTPNNFLCSQFISYLNTGGGKGNIVNCRDCATIVSSFTNIVGASLFASIMFNQSAPANGFACNQILAIGVTTWAVPFRGSFSYHEVAWTGAGSYTDPLYDACLQYDSGPNPWGAGPHTAFLPLKVPFTTQGINPPLPIATPFTSSSYRERLAANSSAGIGSCIPVGPLPNTNSGRRPVL